MLWRDLRGRTRRNTKQLQNLDLLGSPHLEKEWIGRMVDLDLLSCFPKDGQESLERSGGLKLSRFATMEEREQEEILNHWGRRPLKKIPEKTGRWARIRAGPVVLAQRAVLPPYAKLPFKGMMRKPAGPVVPAQRAVLPPYAKLPFNGMM